MCKWDVSVFPLHNRSASGWKLVAFLFSIFLNDLEYFLENHVPGFKCEFSDNDLVTYFKLFVLFYAGDTVMFSETPDDLQRTLNAFSNYCTYWKLTVNVSKTKVMIISRGRQNANINFHYENMPIQINRKFHRQNV